jgi:DNA-binding CsgD family transcriptional regulator
VKQTLRRVYVKLDVQGRAAMAARLASCGWL